MNIKYSSFAFPPYDIKVNKIYKLGHDENGYFFNVGKNKQYLDLNEFKALFTPVDGKWDDVVKTNKVATDKK